MDFNYGSSFGERSPSAYETLLLDAIIGDATLYTRQDMVEASWTVVEPIQNVWREHQIRLPQLRRRHLGTGRGRRNARATRTRLEETVNERNRSARSHPQGTCGPLGIAGQGGTAGRRRRRRRAARLLHDADRPGRGKRRPHGLGRDHRRPDAGAPRARHRGPLERRRRARPHRARLLPVLDALRPAPPDLLRAD